MTTATDPTLDDALADQAPADAKPTRKRSRTPRAPRDKAPAGEAKRGPGRPSNAAKLQQALTERFGMWFGLGAVAAAGGDMARYNAHGSVSRDLVIVAEASGDLARCLVQASESNKALRKMLEMLVQGGDQVELFTVLFTSIALPIAANHDMLPAGPLATMAGSPPPPAPTPFTAADGTPTHAAA